MQGNGHARPGNRRCGPDWALLSRRCVVSGPSKVNYAGPLAGVRGGAVAPCVMDVTRAGPAGPAEAGTCTLARQPLRVARACPYSLAGLSLFSRPNLQRCFLLALAACAGPVVGQAATALWSERAEVAQKALVECFWNEDAGLCEIAFPSQREEPHFHYWWQAHAIDALVDGFERSGNRGYLARATKLWDGVKRRHGGVTIDYYDDMLWMGIALQRLQAHTGDARQRGDVNTLWTDIKLGWSEAQGGGIAWRSRTLNTKTRPRTPPP